MKEQDYAAKATKQFDETTPAVPLVTHVPNRMHHFGTGATRDSDANKLDFEGFLSPPALEAYAEYMHRHRFQADGVVRASDNWQ